MEPKVAIATINLNSDDMTLGCLEELKDLDYKNKELWILDNGSKNKSRIKIEKAMKKYNFHFLKLKINTGYAGGANFLIDCILKKSKPDYILFINNDMLFPDKKFLKKMMKKIEKDSSIAIINPIILTKDKRIQNGGSYLDDYLKYAERIYENVPIAEAPNEDYFIDLYCGCAWLVRVNIFKEENVRFKGNYFAYCEDDEFCIQVRKKNYRILADVSSHVIHLGGASANKMGSGFAIYHITRNEFLF
jgi:GT2 family glycosyltransferase